MGRKKCYFDGDFWHFSMKNGSLKAYFKTFLSVFDKKMCIFAESFLRRAI